MYFAYARGPRLPHPLQGFAQDVPTYLDPATADVPAYTLPDTSGTFSPDLTSAPAATPSSTPSFWDTIGASASQLLAEGVKTGTAVASAALMKKYTATKGAPPPGYTYNPSGALVKTPAGAGLLGGGMTPILALGAVAAVGAFFFLRRK